jgi:tetratricopeptide (TPR) repeat protein
MREIQQAETLEPENSHVRSAHGLILFMAKRYDESLEQYRRSAAMSGDYSWVADGIALDYCMQAQFAKAYEASKLLPDIPWQMKSSLLGATLMMLGRRAEGSRLLSRFASRDVNPWWYYSAIAHASLGQTKLAIKDLRNAVEQRWYEAMWIKVEPTFAELQSQPAFQELIKQTRLTDNQLQGE